MDHGHMGHGDMGHGDMPMPMCSMNVSTVPTFFKQAFSSLMHDDLR